MTTDYCTSYSFSFQLQTCQDIQYYKRTTPGQKLKEKVEAFILKFMKDPKPLTDVILPTGKPPKGKVIEDIDICVPFSFGLKKSTIKKIRAYKKKEGLPNLDKNTEQYIKLTVPCREVR